MNKKFKVLALALTLTMSVALLTACSSQNNGGNTGNTGNTGNSGVSDTNDTGNTGNTGDTGDVESDGNVVVNNVGKVTAVNEDGTIEVTLYSGDADISDYAAADISGYTATEETETLTIGEDVVVSTVTDGALTDADASAITEGAMVIFAKDAFNDNLTQIVVVSTGETAAA